MLINLHMPTLEFFLNVICLAEWMTSYTNLVLACMSVISCCATRFVLSWPATWLNCLLFVGPDPPQHRGRKQRKRVQSYTRGATCKEFHQAGSPVDRWAMTLRVYWRPTTSCTYRAHLSPKTKGPPAHNDFISCLSKRIWVIWVFSYIRSSVLVPPCVRGRKKEQWRHDMRLSLSQQEDKLSRH